jgi:hypothetical protein
MSNDDLSILGWRKSSYSASGNCVEVAVQTESVSIRDSKNPAGGVLSVPSSAWQAFIEIVRTQ